MGKRYHFKQPLRPARTRGFGLLELIVTVTVAGVLLALAVPSFHHLIVQNQLSAQTERLLTALNLTRSEAIRRASRVTLCKSADGSSCAGAGSYSQGWLVFADPDNNANRTAGEEIIRAQPALPSGFSAIGSGTTAADFLSYVADGTARPANGGLPGSGQIGLSDGSATRVICIDSLGRVRIEVTAC